MLNDPHEPRVGARAKVATAHDKTKSVANLKARAAMAGFTLYVLDDGANAPAFLVGRWNMSRTLPDEAAVDAFLNQYGGSRGQ